MPFIFDDLACNQNLGEFIFTNSTKYLASELLPMNLDKKGLEEALHPLQKQMKGLQKTDNPIVVLIDIKND